jgi:ADP-ribose pyrophosphatase YjhB (NUDIX family)
MKIRIYNTVKGIIFNTEEVLLIKKEYEDGRILYTLPGGGQEPGETLEETLSRELYEEIAASVKIVDLVGVYEYKQNSNRDPGLLKHKVEFAFYCHIEGPYSATMGPHPDPHQTDVVWIHRQSLNEINLYPVELKDILLQEMLPGRRIYMGEINKNYR